MEKQNIKSPFWLRVIFRYFIQGLLFMIPITIMAYLTWYLFGLFREYAITSNFWISLGLFLSGVLFFGWLSSTFIARPLFAFLEEVLSSAPLVKFVYTSLKDLTEAFVGNKKKFDKPVLVNIDKAEDVWRMGFITKGDLIEIDMPGHVAVYLPLSYSLSGQLLLVPKDRLRLVEAQTPDALRFVVSGGVTGLH